MNRQTTQSQVYQLLRQALSSGELKLGRKIQEEELASKFNISRTPLREALSRLVQEGLLISIPFKGVFVREYTLREIQQLYELRSVLEVFAVRAACRRASDEELRQIAAHVDEPHNISTQEPELSKLLATNKSFHMAIAAVGKNDWLCSALETLHAHFGLLRLTNLQHPAEQERSVRDHRALVEALLARDEDKAVHLLETHITEAWEFARKTFASDADELRHETLMIATKPAAPVEDDGAMSSKRA